MTPGDVENLHDTKYVFESVLCFYKQQNVCLFFLLSLSYDVDFYLLVPVPDVPLITVSIFAFFCCHERESTAKAVFAGIRPSFLEKFRWRGALNDLQMGSHLPVSLD